MYKIFILLSCILFQYDTVSAQMKKLVLYNTILKDTSLNYISKGINNYLAVRGVNNLAGYFLLNSTGDTIKAYNDVFVFNTYEQKELETFRLYDNRQYIDSFQFISKGVGNIEPIGVYQKKYATVNDIEANPTLEYNFDGYFIYPLTVQSFQLVFLLDDEPIYATTSSLKGSVDTILVVDPVTGEETYSVTTNESDLFNRTIIGNTIPPEYIALIKRLKPNDQLIFNEINVVSSTGNMRSLIPIYIKIME